jgi:hypothetical protein
VVSANTAVRKTDSNGSIQHFDHIQSNRSPKNRHFSLSAPGTSPPFLSAAADSGA